MIPICPRCDRPLLIAVFRDIEVDYCIRCAGIWFDAGELEALLENTGAGDCRAQLDFRCMGTRRIGKRDLCPRCDRPLRQACPAHDENCLELDMCPVGHGIWFDSGELQHLLGTFPPESGAGKTLAHLAEVFAAGVGTMPPSQSAGAASRKPAE